MHKGITFITIPVVLLGACASGKDTAQSAAGRQNQDTMKNSNAGQNEEPSARAREVQDSQIMDLSKADTSEEADWMNPKNPPELKRKYQKGHFSVVLPEDLYPIKMNVSPSAGLFKFQNADAFLYIFSPQGVEASAFLDINLNTPSLNQAKGYHDMTIDLKGNSLKMSYRFDGSNDGYIRYAEIQRSYQPPGMRVSVLLVRDPSVYSNLQHEYQRVLGTLKQENN
jgi:hypothetical protein